MHCSKLPLLAATLALEMMFTSVPASQIESFSSYTWTTAQAALLQKDEVDPMPGDDDVPPDPEDVTPPDKGDLGLPPFEADAYGSGVVGFVTRLYEIALGRVPEEDGLQYWKEQITSGKMTAAEVSFGFVISPEFEGKKYTDEQLVEIMYRTFMNREGEQDGSKYWLEKLKNGLTIPELYAGFVNAEEFFDICESYGVMAGMYLEGHKIDTVNRTYAFFVRLYSLCMDREGDYDGLQFWVKRILEKEMSIGQAASEFVFSKEYEGKNATLEEYVTMLYSAMMDRKPDDDGMIAWKRCGLSREYIFNSFLGCPEFKEICESYGLTDYLGSFKREIPVPDETKPLTGKIVIVDPGHGGTDPGASAGGVFEAPTNLSIALKTKAELEEAGATVIITRDSDKWVGLYYRNALVHQFCMEYIQENSLPDIPYYIRQYVNFELNEIFNRNIDDPEGMGFMGGTGMSRELQTLFFMEQQLDNIVFISIHCNAAGNRDAHGTSIYYVTDESMAESERRMVERDPQMYLDPRCPIREEFHGRDGNTNAYFSRCLYDGVVGSVPAFASGRPTLKDNFCVLREHGLTSAMVEVAYLTNANDRAMLVNEDIQQKVAEGITNGIIKYFS
ncbi:MAG: DUF4214 domain-containing protein [Clostridiales bacterium]|nr:DUF4214 domain-containing protein [Clostridiales bacterium]